jgi:zinc transport system substrate-binding protein
MERLNRILLIVILCSLSLFSSPLPSMAEGVVLASTSLVGAIAKAAGAKEVRVLTPGEVRHPPEYDLKPSDLLRFEGVDIVVYGGYERMVAKLLETSKNKKVLVIQIETDTSPESLVTQARKISKILKTEKEEQTWERHFSARLKDLQKKISPFSGKKAVVHRFAEPFARWTGLSIVQIISPGELTPKVVAKAIAKKPELVVDIRHFPIAGVIAENAKCRYIQIINFPGIGSTRTLEDIFEYNAFQLIKAYR